MGADHDEDEDAGAASDPTRSEGARRTSLLASAPKDGEAEIKALIAKARGKVDSIQEKIDENAGNLKQLKDEFRQLKRQQNHLAREQQSSINLLECGLASRSCCQCLYVSECSRNTRTLVNSSHTGHDETF